ncbi:MAG: TRAM domain-containing protein, partial [Gammaproteobacteria bacterium]|nr:TRAM domain-containing protein [Gammaproteobacteria bacterium]
EKLKRQIPESVIRTSLMVGFPGETEAQFEELVQFVRDYPLDNIGVFQFSLEEGAHAAMLDGHLPEEVKAERHARLMETQMEVVQDLNQKYVGQKLEVIVEGYHPDSEFLMTGRFYGQCPEIDGQVIINDCEAVENFGQLHTVEITDVMDYDLIGRAIGPVAPKIKRSPLALV